MEEYNTLPRPPRKPDPKPEPKSNPNPKGGDPRKDIYIHSKVILIDQAFGMLGSANHNERSMEHDSEDMLAFRSSERYNLVGQMQKDLMGIVLNGNLPKIFDAKTIFEKFKAQMKLNSDEPNNPVSLVYPLEPAAGLGSILIG